MSRAVAILLCAGGSTRMGFDKLLTPIAGKTAIERSMDALVLGGAEQIVFAVSSATRDYVEHLHCPVDRCIIIGGETRAQSVKNALGAIENADIVAIHDAARCMISPATIRESIMSAERYGSGVVSGRVTDTIVLLSEGRAETLDRSKLIRMQTPQTFLFSRIKAAYSAGDLSAVTDDCALYIQAGYEPHFVFTEGEVANQKLTSAEDWQLALASYARFGTGFDTHRLVEGRKLILGGVEIAYEKGLLGHSDADVLTHAIMDALLGAAGLGDIGRLFPDTDAAYAGADSIALLREVVLKLEQNDLRVAHVDATIIAQRPKIMPYAAAMQARLSEAMQISPASVSVKATTTEGMNDEGKGLCISASAIVSLV